MLIRKMTTDPKSKGSPITLFKQTTGFPCTDCHLVFHSKLLLSNHSKSCLNRCVKNAKKQVSFFSIWSESTDITSNVIDEDPKILPLSQPLLTLSQINQDLSTETYHPLSLLKTRVRLQKYHRCLQPTALKFLN